MIEPALVHRCEIGGGVTRVARRAEAAGVGVLVAVRALPVRYRAVQRDFVAVFVHGCNATGHVVALFALDVEVTPCQWISGSVMFESNRRRPALVVVAGQAVRVQRPRVSIDVARKAIRLESEPARPIPAGLEHRRDGAVAQVGSMTGFAAQLRVLASQRPADVAVIEIGGRAVVPTNEIEIVSDVIGMTGGAILL